MIDAMNDLGLEYVDTDNYDALRAQIYEYYGVSGILGAKGLAPHAEFDFPEPLKLCRGGTLPSVDIAAANLELGKEQFFKHLLHPAAKALLPFVNTVLATEHKNSPIFAASANLDIDRESIAQIVDRAYHLARAAGAVPSPQAKALLNTLVLAELLVWR